MNNFLSFFQKYKLHINVLLLVFWIYLIYEAVTSYNFNFRKIVVPVLFIVLTCFNINQTIKEQKK